MWRVASHLRTATVAALLLVWLVGCGTAPLPAASSQARGSYTVRAGDTVYSIATRHGMTVSELRRLNDIGGDFRIYPGQVLRVAGKPGVAVTPQAKVPAITLPANLNFRLPTQGNHVATTRPNGGLGWVFAGRTGQAIEATAAGRVVYSGSGLLGYGQLLIIKHDEQLLSAYGHLAQITVREGDAVSAGQPIATMGNGVNGQAQLYFEIRYNGKPIDPAMVLAHY